MNLTKQEATNTITLTGAQMSRTALIIDDGVTDEQLGQIGLALVGIEGARCWWIGDYGVCLTNRKGEHYTAGRAEAIGIDAGQFRDCVCVARFYKPSVRSYDSLSFGHYRVAQFGSDGDIQRAQEWLEKAQEAGWSVSQLRKAINLANATAVNTAKEPLQDFFKFGDDFDRWVTTKRKSVLPDIDKDTAINLLEVRWLGTVQFIDELREIAKG